MIILIKDFNSLFSINEDTVKYTKSHKNSNLAIQDYLECTILIDNT